MGAGVPQATIKRHLNKLAKKYAGVEFRVLRASNGEAAILPVDSRTGEPSTENPRKLQVQYLWDRMCAADRILSHKANFVVFSKNNPFQSQYNEAMALMQAGR